MQDIIGSKIEAIRDMTVKEMEREGWEDSPRKPPVIVLSNGTILYPSRDPEGNGPGALFGFTNRNQTIAL